MHNCNYCYIDFKARPQVKSPKACNNRNCQHQRQRDNEKSWHSRNAERFGRHYHNRRKKIRKKLISKQVAEILNALSIGMRFLGSIFDDSLWIGFLEGIFFRLGLRQTNKLCGKEI